MAPDPTPQPEALGRSGESKDLDDLLTRVHAGTEEEREQLLAFVYDRLHEIASALMARERPEHTLQATALVHEAWLRLMKQRSDWRDGHHFLRVAALVMRRLLVNHAVARKTLKRGDGREAHELDSILGYYESRSVDLVELNDALTLLAERDKLAADVVELRFFAGLEVAEAAEVLEVSKSTVERAWLRARRRLQRALGPG